jgi:hypothetical protein
LSTPAGLERSKLLSLIAWAKIDAADYGWAGLSTRAGRTSGRRNGVEHLQTPRWWARLVTAFAAKQVVDRIDHVVRAVRLAERCNRHFPRQPRSILLLANVRVVRWLAQNKPEYLSEFQSIAGLTSLPTDISGLAAE